MGKIKRKIKRKEQNMKMRNSKPLSGWTAKTLALVLALNFLASAVHAGTRVVVWGNTNQWAETPPPADLTNAVAIVSGDGGYDLALKSDGTVIAWGLDVTH